MTRDEAFDLKKRLETKLCTRGYMGLSQREREAYDKLRGFFKQPKAAEVRKEIRLWLFGEKNRPQEDRSELNSSQDGSSHDPDNSEKLRILSEALEKQAFVLSSLSRDKVDA